MKYYIPRYFNAWKLLFCVHIGKIEIYELM